MKTLTTLALLLFFTLFAQGQDRKPEPRVETIAMELVPVSRILLKIEAQEHRVARLYRRPNARVKKALTFTTRENRPKLA
ncbi:MAG: hypothetical protein R3252_07660 [Robiginitalea sp.]|nr:hypothetical protein [Robiginitalea sp.]